MYSKKHVPTPKELLVFGFLIWWYWPEIKWTLYHLKKLSIVVWRAITYTDIRDALKEANLLK